LELIIPTFSVSFFLPVRSCSIFCGFPFHSKKQNFLKYFHLRTFLGFLDDGFSLIFETITNKIFFRFSSMAAERISSSSRPSVASSGPRISKASIGGRLRRNRNDRGMEIDQVGSSSNSRDSRGAVPGNRNNRNRNNRNNNTNNPNNNNRNRKSQVNQKPKKSSLNQSDLDNELESYMMKNESTARNTLDMELDSYMSAAPSKS
jgi:hypothetical protein